jgi:hypothetical protein
MSTPGADRASPLERRCRLLLRAYPASYRHERGEEIVGTLLEATPQGRSWPLPRDVRSLVSGGLRARAALTKRATTAANLRLAALVGLAAYFAMIAAWIMWRLLAGVKLGTFRFGDQLWSFQLAWPELVVGASLVATLVLVWVTRRRGLVLAAAVPAAGILAFAGPWQQATLGAAITNLSALAALIALVGGRRPSRRWLWPVGLVAVWRPLFGIRLPGVGSLPVAVLLIAVVLALAVAGLVWLMVDARPAIAMVVSLLCLSLPSTIDNLATGAGLSADLPLLLICAAVCALAVWRLRRQSARPDRPSQT